MWFAGGLGGGLIVAWGISMVVQWMGASGVSSSCDYCRCPFYKYYTPSRVSIFYFLHLGPRASRKRRASFLFSEEQPAFPKKDSGENLPLLARVGSNSALFKGTRRIRSWRALSTKRKPEERRSVASRRPPRKRGEPRSSNSAAPTRSFVNAPTSRRHICTHACKLA